MKKLLALLSSVVLVFTLMFTTNLLDTTSPYYDGVEKAPKIALLPQKEGDQDFTVVMDQWTYYIEPGFLGYNRLTQTNITGAVVIEESDLNIEAPGTYYIRYALTANGITTRVKRTVIVEEAPKPDNFVPVPAGELGNPGGVGLNKPTDPTDPVEPTEPEVIIKEVIKEVEKIVEVPAECEPCATNWGLIVISALVGAAVGAGVMYFVKKN